VPYPYNRLVVAPGEALDLGSEGGVLLLNPPAQVPGAMALTDLQNRTWHLLRERGPDTGWPAPTTGDFNITVVTRDLNIALAQFISETGISPSLTEKVWNCPVFPLLDYPVPPDLVSLMRVEYTPSNEPTYKLVGLSQEEFDNVTGNQLYNEVGQPYYYRRPFAGYIRLQPQPGFGQYVGPGTGTIIVSGTPTAGQTVTATLSNGYVSYTTQPYTVLNTDTPVTIASALASLINQSGAVVGVNAFYAPCSAINNQITLTAASTPGTALTYYCTVGGVGSLIVSPSQKTNLTPNGDVITFFGSTLGTILADPGDTPNIPPMYHMALVYRVLGDYWERKQDATQSDRYMKKYAAAVQQAKAFKYDVDQSSQFGTGYDDTPDMSGWW